MEILFLILLGLIFTVSFIFLKKNELSDDKFVIKNKYNIFFSTSSFVSSALGFWIIFSPAAAATWGGMGNVIGYALGAAMPLILFIFIGKYVRKVFPNSSGFHDCIENRFGKSLSHFVIIVSLIYMTVFLIAEITAISKFFNFLNGTSYWISSIIIILIALSYVLLGGLSATIFTDLIQFIFIIGICLFLVFKIPFQEFSDNTSFMIENAHLFDFNNQFLWITGLTFLIAVTFTNLFHHGNWQRIYAAKDDNTLSVSLIISTLIIFIIVYFIGYSGLVSISLYSIDDPDLTFVKLFGLLETSFIKYIFVILAASLVLSSIDTLINAINSQIVSLSKSYSFKSSLNIYFILVFLVAVFILSSQGYNVLYVFLIADLICCCLVLPFLLGLFGFNISIKQIYIISFLSLLLGVLIFPDPSFSKNIMSGFLNINLTFINNYKLFSSFLVPILFSTILTLLMKKKGV